MMSPATEPPGAPNGPDGAGSTGPADALEELVFETLEALEIDGPEALDRAAAAHPAQAEELRRRISSLRTLGLVAGGGPDDESLPGTMGPYQLGAPLGEGGMGRVVAAYDSTWDRSVALKLVRPHLLDAPDTRARFDREVDAAGRLRHPGIARIFESGTHDGLPFVAMERIEGCTLTDLIDALAHRRARDLLGADALAAITELVGPPPIDTPGPALFAGGWPEFCARVVRDAAEALAEAHQAGILHRDIKASNIMVTPSGRVVLIDFGLARLDDSTTVTQPGAWVGSLPYSPPERAGGHGEATPRGDVYGLGVVLYELLCLQLPYRGSTAHAVVQAILHGERPSLTERVPGAPADLVRVVDRTLRRTPARRTPNAAALALDLASVLRGTPPVPHGDGAIRVLGAWCRSHPVSAAALLLAVSIAVAGPASWLRLRTNAAVRESASVQQSAERLGIVLDYAASLKASIPVPPELMGTRLDTQRRIALSTLMDIEGRIAEDPRLVGPLSAVRASANLGRDLSRAALRSKGPSGASNPRPERKGATGLDVVALAEEVAALHGLRATSSDLVTLELDLARAKDRLGSAFEAQGNHPRALREAYGALDTWRRLAAAFPRSGQVREAVVAARATLNDRLARQNQAARDAAAAANVDPAAGAEANR